MITAIQTANAAIAGIVSTPDGALLGAMPSQIESAQLPLVMVWPGRGAIDPASRNEVQRTRRYDGAVLLAPEASGVGITTNAVAIWAWLETFGNAWAATLIAGGDLADGIVVTHYEDSGDTGGFVTYRGKRWAGFTFRLDIWEAA